MATPLQKKKDLLCCLTAILGIISQLLTPFFFVRNKWDTKTILIGKCHENTQNETLQTRSLRKQSPYCFFLRQRLRWNAWGERVAQFGKEFELRMLYFHAHKKHAWLWFHQEALADLFATKCIFDPRSNQLVALKDIKEPVLFSADLGADLAKKECEQLQLALASRFKEIIITDHHESPSEIFTIDQLNYINFNTKHQVENNLFFDKCQ